MSARAACVQAPAAGPRLLRARQPQRVSYDARSLMLDGKRFLWLSGGMHYGAYACALRHSLPSER